MEYWNIDVMKTLEEDLGAKKNRDGGYTVWDNEQIGAAKERMSHVGIPKDGEMAIDFILPNHSGENISLHDILKKGPAILNFFRGNFCEYCQLELKALQRYMGEFERYEATLVGISPSAVTVQTVLKDELKLSYSILSDVGSKVADLYGLTYDVSNELVEAFDGFGFSFDDNFVRNNDKHNMTIPATFVVAPSGEIVFAFSDADHTKRTEPSEIVASLISISG